MLKIVKPFCNFAILYCLLGCSALHAYQAPLVVSPDGPIKTLEEARLKVRELKKEQPDQSIEVLIKGGVYPLRETVVFGLEDSGSKEAPVVYKAIRGEKPVFTGGVPITGWEKLSSDPQGVSKKAQGKLWVAEIPKDLSKQWRIKSLYDLSLIHI